MEEAVGEAQSQQRRQRPGLAGAQRPQPARHGDLRLALALHRGGLDPGRAAEAPEPDRQRRHGGGGNQEGGSHVRLILSA